MSRFRFRVRSGFRRRFGFYSNRTTGIWHEVHPVAAEPDVVNCTSWDEFHRVDRGGMRTVRRVAAAQEVFDLSTEVQRLFGSGEGRLLLRGVSAHIGEKTKEAIAPGGTRKFASLCGVAGTIIDNYKSYTAGLHLRMEWRRAGHSTQSLESLAEIGRRLSDPAFVVFLVCFNDILVRVVRPYAMVVQAARSFIRD